ncbi:hypothetical protein J5N97_011423 [Dioscorea zingiberensis]|uniref:F-box domain-containing protein n=1 Tax=Dioscorea zingiberensis TaxID=325984 RepID=A0A9D5D313_9LILI|nr:hypothetical protein J5N97_011423 [Dioscorea zingiberensis]
MGRGDDRISNMPDPILETILTMMPLKSAIRTSVLSRRWRSLWEHNLLSTTTLDFDEDFSTSQSPKEFVLNVNRYLHQLQHTSKKLDKFSVYFCPFDLFLPEIQRWISFAISKGVKELNLDLSQGFTDPRHGGFIDGRAPFRLPDCLFQCKSLTHLSLSRCDLLSSPLAFAHWSQLQSLSLKLVSLSQDGLHDLLNNSCKQLQSLTLNDSLSHQNVNLALAPDLRLKSLTMVDSGRLFDMEIFAPNLQSFHYYGEFCRGSHSFNVSSLVDAFICPLKWPGGDDLYVTLLTDLSHVKVLTINTAILWDIVISEENEQLFPIGFHNLQELQLIVDSMTDESLDDIYGFFRLCPCPFLERLFIQLSGRKEEDPVHVNHAIKAMQGPQYVDFNHLEVIKLTNFKGWGNEIRLLKFLLEKALVLESLIIVTAPLEKNKKPSERRRLAILRGQLSKLPKASSQAHIVLCESCEDDKRCQPLHADVNPEYYYLEDRFTLALSMKIGVDLEVLT